MRPRPGSGPRASAWKPPPCLPDAGGDATVAAARATPKAVGPCTLGDDFHVELGLRHAAVGAVPAVGDVGPARAGREAFRRQALGLVVDEAAGPALPGLVRLVGQLTQLPCRSAGRP